MSRPARLVGASMVPALAVPLVASVATARSSDVPPPPSNPNLPRELDVASPYLPQTICDPDAKPGVTAFARLMANHYSEFSYGISRACNYGLTEHSEGRALDWMLNAYDAHEREVADSVLAWLLAPDSEGRPAAMARRFGIMYIIWNRQIWGTYNMSAGWRPYSGVSPHTDHIHFSFSWDGAMQRTSWWTGKAWTGVTTTPGGPSVPVPEPTTYPTLRQGASGPDVALAQKVIGVTADGQFGPATLAALKTWQGKNSVPVTGVLDRATWDRMVALGKIPARGDVDGGLTRYFDTTLRLGSSGEAVKALQKTLRITADGQFGSGTERAVKAFQEKKTLTVDGVVTRNVWRALAGLSYTKTGTTTPPTPRPEPTVTLRPGDSNSAVPVLQKLLGITADGQFGPATERAVRDFQKSKQLRVDGIVTTNVWKALRGQPYVTTGVAPAPKPPAITSSTEYTAVKSQVLALGSRGAAVKVLQRALGGVAVDGVFGSGTERALRSFQSAHRLPTTGIADERTWDALEQRDYPFLAYRTTVLRKGSTGYAVYLLQRYLGVQPADRTFGDATADAVRALQGRHGLARTGYVGGLTWQALEREVRARRAG